ncbi:MAG: histidine kinase, partial [Bacteroidia bacterium]|nr:histidine kinase [Bacteroidia bacterium]
GTSNLLKSPNISISLWVKLDRRVYSGKGFDANPIITIKNGTGEDFINALVIAYQCYNNCFAVNSTKDSLTEVTITSNKKINFNEWYHLVFICNNKALEFYINGELQGRSKKNFETKFLSTDSMMVGHSASKKNERFSQGIFDDIKIFHKSLNANEIEELYNAENPNKFANFLSECVKYGIVLLVFSSIIVFILINNKRNLKKQKNNFELLNRVSELELKVIKAQMNPHFISNCLAAIQDLIYQKDLDKAGHYLAKFSFFLRQILKYSDKNYILLSEEIEIIKLNIELEGIRFKNNFEFQLNIAENVEIEDQLVPALITQPFIENAIWHGLLPLNNARKPLLKISIYKLNELPVIEIEDNGIGRNLLKLIDVNSKGTKLIFDKIESLNKMFNTVNYKMNIVDLYDSNNSQIGTKVILQLDNVKE